MRLGGGVWATLSVTLPTAASAGGELIVRHRDREARIDMNASEPSEVAFAAFYADCAHETLPIREGCRLSLVFNICLRPGDTETPRQAPDYSDQVRDIAEHLIAWRDGAHGPDKLIWLLEHEYSEAGLSFDALKNADAALGEVLNLAAERADCELHASIVHIEEHGSASYIDGSYLDEWDQRGDDTDDVEMDEVFEGRYWLDGWTSGDGARPAFGELSVNPGELLPRRALDDAEPDEQWVNESSGNAGVTLERAYRHAAFVIWPHRATLDILAGENIDGAVDWARRQVERGAVEAGDLIARLISVWPVERPGRMVTPGPTCCACWGGLATRRWRFGSCGRFCCSATTAAKTKVYRQCCAWPIRATLPNFWLIWSSRAFFSMPTPRLHCFCA